MSRPARHVEVAQIMGTAVSVHVVGELAAARVAPAVGACFDELRQADRVFSPYRDDSDILRLARGELTMTDASPWVAEVAHACARAQADTGGLFTATWAGVFDPTGYVKGWAVERATRAHLAPLLALPGAIAVGVNAGGDMQLFTAADADWSWNVAIVDPADRARVLATVPVRDGAVATSGSTERGSHIIDPRTGRAATGARSATVVSPRLTHADVWATAAVVAGIDDLTWIGRAGRSSGLIADGEGRVRRWLDGVEVEVAVAGRRRDDDAVAVQADRRIFSIDLPRASSSTSLSR